MRKPPCSPPPPPLPPPRPADAAPKKPTKFLADLTRAMQTAAEASRAATMEQFQPRPRRTSSWSTLDPPTRQPNCAGRRRGHRRHPRLVEGRARADPRGDRPQDHPAQGRPRRRARGARRLDRAKVERVQSRVDAFETEMERFFERLMTEDDPAEFAAMAENLPEPPPLDFDDDGDYRSAARAEVDDEPDAVAEAVAEVAERATPPRHGRDRRRAVSRARDARGRLRPSASPRRWRRLRRPGRSSRGRGGHGRDRSRLQGGPDRRRAPARRRRPRPAIRRRPAPGRSWHGHRSRRRRGRGRRCGRRQQRRRDPDHRRRRPRGPAGGARPRGWSARPRRRGSEGGPPTSQVVVTGLVSVASIASFKRHLGRVAGVQSVGVSSGPDGEFVFKVAHGAEVVLRDAIPTLPGFEARVTGTGDGVVNVSARDPESEG